MHALLGEAGAAGAASTSSRRVAALPDGALRRGHAAGGVAFTRWREVACAAGAVRRRKRLYDGDDGAQQSAAERKLEACVTFVRDVQPNDVGEWMEGAPPAVVQAMKQAVSNMTGALPPQQFAVSITAAAESLACLAQTMLRTGYLLRSVHLQLELENALQGASATTTTGSSSGPLHNATHHHAQQQPFTPAATAHASGLTPHGAQPFSLPARPADALLPPASPVAVLAPSGSTGAVAATHTQPPVPNIILAPPSAAAPGLAPVPLLQGAGGTGGAGSAGGGGDRSGGVALEVPGGGWSEADDQYAPGVQLSRVQGEALRWHPQHGVERLPATDYIRLLEQRVEALQRQLQQQQPPPPPPPVQLPQLPPPPQAAAAVAESAGGSAAAAAAALIAACAGGGGGVTAAAAAAGGEANPVLAYVRRLDPAAVAALGTCSPEVSSAMSLFVARLLGSADGEELRSVSSEFSAVELSKLLFWLLVVGWGLRSMEVSIEMEERFGGA